MQDSSSLTYYMMPIQHKENMQVLLAYERPSIGQFLIGVRSYLGEERLTWLTVPRNVVYHSKQGTAIEAAPGQNPGSIRRLLITGLTRKQSTAGTGAQTH